MNTESTPHMAMYTPEGNAAVIEAVEALLPTIDAMGRTEAGLPDRWTFADMLHNQLAIAHPDWRERFGEAGDTAVRESAQEYAQARLIESYGWEAVTE